MARGETDLLKQVLEKLQYLDPPIRKFPVTPEDPAMAVYFLDLKDVCLLRLNQTLAVKKPCL
jgi:hypothetical protein